MARAGNLEGSRARTRTRPPRLARWGWNIIMNISPSQLKRFWNKQNGWPAIVAKHGWDSTQAETERKAMLARAGFDSLTLVDPGAGFSRVLNELAALNDDLAGMLKAQANERRVLEYKIEELGIAI